MGDFVKNEKLPCESWANTGYLLVGSYKAWFLPVSKVNIYRVLEQQINTYESILLSLKVARFHLAITQNEVNWIAWDVSRGIQLTMLAHHTPCSSSPWLSARDWFTQVGVAELWSECRIWTLTRQRCAVHRITWQNAKVAPRSTRRRRWWWWWSCCWCLIADCWCCWCCCCCCLVAFAGTERNGKWQFPSSCCRCCNSNLLHEEAACQTVIALI